MRWGWLASALLLAGCFVDRSGTAGVVDGGGAPRREGGTHFDPFDAGPTPDVGSTCDATDQRCDGERAILCNGGTPRVVECSGSNAFCDESSGTPTCVTRVCVPDATECNGDGTAVLRCDARGASSTPEPCERGCTDGACNGPTSCSLPVWRTLTGDAETLRVNLCASTDDTDYVKEPDDDCPDMSYADGGDVVLRLGLSAPRRYRFDVRDVDDFQRIDPAVYVWSDCVGSAEAQVGCADQGGDVENDARLELDLAAGDWFVMVDAYRYPIDGECGEVEVVVTPL